MSRLCRFRIIPARGSADTEEYRMRGDRGSASHWHAGQEEPRYSDTALVAWSSGWVAGLAAAHLDGVPLMSNARIRVFPRQGYGFALRLGAE